MNSSPRILVVSRTAEDRAYMEDFFERTPFGKPDFVVGQFVLSDKYDFIVFDCRTIPLYKPEDFIKLPEAIQQHFFLLERYINESTKYILFFGRFYHNLNYERCPSANSKFTLFARIREMMEFARHFEN